MASSSLLRLIGGLLSALLLAFSLPTHAQNYKPFTTGRTYHYRETAPTAGAADTLFTFRVDSVAVSGADSTFYFNRTTRQVPPSTQPAPLRRVNVFGGWMRWTDSSGVAILGAADTAATLEIRTREPLNQPWPFSAGGLTARITGRSVSRFLGILDTLLTVRLSDNRTLLIGRKLGVIDGPNLDYYLGQTYSSARRRRDLTLAAVPEIAPAPTVDLRWQSIWNLQPGDTLIYHNTAYVEPPLGPGDAWSERERELVAVRQRWLSAGGDSIGLAVTRIRRNDRFDDAFFSIPDTSTYTIAGDTVWLSPTRGISPSATPEPMNLSFAVLPGAYAVALQHPDSLGGRAAISWRSLVPDAAALAECAAGLGLTRSEYYVGGSGSSGYSHRLVGFVKDSGATQWGDVTAPEPLSISPDRLAAVPATLAPNPAPVGAASVLHLSLDRPQAVSLALYDAVGRVVWTDETDGLPAGAHRLPVATGAAFAPGLYHLRLTLADGRHRTLRLVRQ